MIGIVVAAGSRGDHGSGAQKDDRIMAGKIRRPDFAVAVELANSWPRSAAALA